MTGQNVAAVLNADGTLEERFHQVAPGAEDADHESEAEPEGERGMQGENGRILVVTNEIPDDGCGYEHEEAAADAAFPALARRNAGEQLVLAQQRTAAVGAGVAHPKEDEDGEGQPGVERGREFSGVVEGQHVDAREGQGDVHLREHGVGPVVDGILLFQIEFRDEEIDEREQVRDEYGRALGDAAAVAGHGNEEINAGHGGDEAVDGDGRHMLVDESGELPDGQSGDKCEQEDHGGGLHETNHDGSNKEDACDGSYDEILHNR